MDCVIPDLVWLSKERYSALLDEESHWQGAPELVIEVVSPGKEKYWTVDWQRQMGVLQLLPGFYCPLSPVWA